MIIINHIFAAYFPLEKSIPIDSTYVSSISSLIECFVQSFSSILVMCCLGNLISCTSNCHIYSANGTTNKIERRTIFDLTIRSKVASAQRTHAVLLFFCCCLARRRFFRFGRKVSHSQNHRHSHNIS